MTELASYLREAAMIVTNISSSTKARICALDTLYEAANQAELLERDLVETAAALQSLYTEALDRILASPQSRDVEEGLDIMEQLAELAASAARVYAPSRIGRLTI